jgi:hypothetical protein
MLVMGDMPLGKRAYWPIYAAAERLGLPIGIHAGSNYHNPPTSVGWGSYHIEDYVAQAQAFQTQLTSLIVEGVFARHPKLKMVMLESGFTWLPSYLWRLHKFWRGIRMETPWVDRAPLEIVRSNIRFSLQPIDAPPDPATLNRLFDHMQSDELLLFSTDYPHWQFDGEAVLPEGMSSDLVRKIMIDNPHATYGRLKQNLRRRRHERAVPQEPGAGFVRSCQDRDCRLRYPSGACDQNRVVSLSRQALARASRDLRQASLSGHDGRTALSEGAAQCVAPRRLSAGRRPAGLVAVVHASAASRSQQCRARRAQSARPGRASAITI